MDGGEQVSQQIRTFRTKNRRNFRKTQIVSNIWKLCKDRDDNYFELQKQIAITKLQTLRSLQHKDCNTTQNLCHCLAILRGTADMMDS